ncbi:Ribokinase-like protein [Blyttiomyces helicus]|uniref:Ribokinase n=1 Tax=Blyttiomyces helicus TaxID=388810 RepID=A0A4P9WJF0_9FUNG|nr:Ribokinase-like protein [Blyttiomyces helicus]|eukprot:RKO92492.1 Ribokinase-like protein [Blyttiomyces helicus]
MPKVLCFGSLNIDDVFTVPHIVATGETIASTSYNTFPGGKGAEVYHAGRIGKDGEWLADLLVSHGVNTEFVIRDATEPTGRAIIQVSSKSADNAIVLFPGANARVTAADADAVLASGRFKAGDWVVLQNEVPAEAGRRMLERAKAMRLFTVLSPAPCTPTLLTTLPLSSVDILIANHGEATTLLGGTATPNAAAAAEALLERFPALLIAVVTAGSKGAFAASRDDGGVTFVPALEGVKAVDTTGAGDTFVGFFVATMAHRVALWPAMEIAVAASGIACESEGAMVAVPTLEVVKARMPAE